MEDSHTAAMSAVISSLQGFCRSTEPKNRQACRREIYERVVMEEVSRTDDPEYIKWREENEGLLRGCLEECRVSGKTMVKPCNSRCLNPMVQGIWKRSNIPEYEIIIGKYANNA